MSSYNNIRKIKYTKNPSDIVTLHEYIVFEDSHLKEKYVVFKFSNNLNQRLLSFKFEVLQYNQDNELIEKTTVLHDNFVAEANDLFVPNAKLKINFECESLEVKLISASFDRVAWRDGEFKDNSYSFNSYAGTVIGKSVNTSPSTEDKKSKDNNKKKIKSKVGFSMRNIFGRNKAKFPAVFNVFLCLIVVGLVVFSTFYFKNVTGAFTIDDFVVKESSLGYVTILDYIGKDDGVEIPPVLESGDRSYYVVKIAKGAFRNSDIKTIELKTKKTFVIETGAFENCGELTAVAGAENCGEVVLMESSFINCQALNSFYVPTAELYAKCFDGTNNIKNLAFDSVMFSEGKLLDIFNGLDHVTFEYFSMNSRYVDSFMEGVTVR